jgi:hypothetical protein
MISGQGKEDWQTDHHSPDHAAGQHEPQVCRGRPRSRPGPEHAAQVSRKIQTADFFEIENSQRAPLSTMYVAMYVAI